jgi:hypothetical protein
MLRMNDGLELREPLVDEHQTFVREATSAQTEADRIRWQADSDPTTPTCLSTGKTQEL